MLRARLVSNLASDGPLCKKGGISRACHASGRYTMDGAELFQWQFSMHAGCSSVDSVHERARYENLASRSKAANDHATWTDRPALAKTGLRMTRHIDSGHSESVAKLCLHVAVRVVETPIVMGRQGDDQPHLVCVPLLNVNAAGHQ